MQLSNGQYLMFVRTAYMKEYKGITENDKPSRGGSFVEKTGIAHEAYNFKPYKNKCYGYFQLGKELNLNRLGGSKEEDYANNILIIIIASHYNKGNVIVGWYDHATAYKIHQNYPDNLKRFSETNKYNFKAAWKDCFLVPEEKRIKLFPSHFTNKMRRTFHWYAEDEEDKEIVNRSLKFMKKMLIRTVHKKKN